MGHVFEFSVQIFGVLESSLTEQLLLSMLATTLTVSLGV